VDLNRVEAHLSSGPHISVDQALDIMVHLNLPPPACPFLTYSAPAHRSTGPRLPTSWALSGPRVVRGRPPSCGAPSRCSPNRFVTPHSPDAHA
jgi:hypothetical protein